MVGSDQVVHHLRVGGRDLAWSQVGTGPVVVVGGWWCSHLTLNWADDAFRRFLLTLAERFTVVRYDRPGTGLADRRGPVPRRLDEELELLSGLVDGAGLGRVHLLGASSGCAVAMAFAAARPGDVDRLVLYGSYLRGRDIAAPEARDALLDVVGRHWGMGSRVLADLFVPNGSAREREAFAVVQRRSVSREDAVAALASVYATDATESAGRVRAPTLVVHRRGDRAIPVALGREVAEVVPRARFVELPGDDHFPWLGGWREVADAVGAFLSGRVVTSPRAPGSPRATELSSREREVLRLVARGLTDAQIAEQLVLSPHTVHRHVANIRTKLGVPTRSAAAARMPVEPPPA